MTELLLLVAGLFSGVVAGRVADCVQLRSLARAGKVSSVADATEKLAGTAAVLIAFHSGRFRTYWVMPDDAGNVLAERCASAAGQRVIGRASEVKRLEIFASSIGRLRLVPIEADVD